MAQRIPARLRPGLVSITLRHLGPDAIIAACRDAGLESIEWGADVHVLPGDLANARAVGERTRAAGLEVAAYGSYLRFGGDDAETAEEIAQVVATADALGAPRIRVWAGEKGSARTSDAERAVVVRRLSDAARTAAERGMCLTLEFHGGTLTDTVGSTLALIHEVRTDDAAADASRGGRLHRPAVCSGWQPNVGWRDDDAIASLHAVLPHLSTVHVFSWWPTTERLPLRAREGLWRGAIGVLGDHVREHGGVHDLLLEFVPDDDPTLLPSEAATLRGWIDEAMGPAIAR